jgi:hypothetical protein
MSTGHARIASITTEAIAIDKASDVLVAVGN